MSMIYLILFLSFWFGCSGVVNYYCLKTTTKYLFSRNLNTIDWLFWMFLLIGGPVTALVSLWVTSPYWRDKND